MVIWIHDIAVIRETAHSSHHRTCRRAHDRSRPRLPLGGAV